MRLSVVVPCFNAASTLAVQLNALSRQSVPPWEVIVADNGSQDASKEIANGFTGRLPRLQVIDASRRRGAGAARNVGAAAATGTFVAFCDADDEVDQRWVEGLAAALQSHDFVASRFDFARLNAPGPAYVHEQETGLQTRQYGYLPHAGGSGLALRRSVHQSVGGFDESISFLEDTDYCWRVQQSGTPLAFAGAAVVHVRTRALPLAAFRQARTWACSEVMLYKRYRGPGLQLPGNAQALAEWAKMPRILIQAARGRRSWYGFWWRLGTRVGRLQGSIAFFILMF